MWDEQGQQFGVQLAGILRLELSGPPTEHTSLFEDWAIDSLQAFEMIVVIEALAETVVPPAELPELYTVGDAYRYYKSLRHDAADH